MEDKILNILKTSTEHVSGEFLSSSLNVSRTAVWKHIKNLKNKGYIIEGISNKGYKLLSSPDKINKPDLFAKLKTTAIGRNFIHYDLIDSTNIKAKELAKDNCPHGTLIVAEKQSGGNGRFKRAWNSPAGGLWFTLVLRPHIPTSEAPKITQIAAACIYKTFNNFNINTKIKWPNDIYLNGKKLCGILGEMNCDMDSINYLVIGIGMNLNLDISVLDEDVQKTATSLKDEYHKDFDRNAILAEFLNCFEMEYDKFSNNLDLKETIEICRNHSNIWGKQAKLITYNKEEIVTCISLSDEGNLIIKDAQGNKMTVLSGEISFKI
ncbi:biotin--[acetyl-CoA-carboxylase] ligase [uncultured Clostridium sp.]|uniref:biotin--[acetyl-CoA-carboxylase] ligase n=1 Tax=uncultured Clostridium sp. TaxID=59620 RepID=UPI0025DDD6E7|nr:biotin--[acetyl-CoA-carboxylase] ligase [uncultured Clostridium sp.]